MDSFWSMAGYMKDGLTTAKESMNALVGVQSENLPRPDIPKLPVQPERERTVIDLKGADFMLPGEKCFISIPKACFECKKPFFEPEGRLVATNFRLRFQAPKGTFSREDLVWLQTKQVLDIPLGLIEEVKLECPPSATGAPRWRLKIITKDGRIVFINVPSPDNLNQVEEHIAALSQPGEHFTSALFAFAHAQASGLSQNGWDIYNPSAEYSRMGVDTPQTAAPSSPWSVTSINQEYGLCSTYPSMLVVPRSMTEAALRGVAQFRKRGRLPTMSWCGGPSLSYASLWRCSQPGEGMMGNNSTDDEQLLQMIRAGAGGAKRDLLTLDLRSMKAAYANKVGGGGFEDYPNCKLVFGGVDNVHGVREAWRKMYKAVHGLEVSKVGSWLRDVADSGWYDIMGAIFHCVVLVVNELGKEKCSAVVHCSDGWDRTAQVSSLAMLCLDPHYRTLRGFCILIQKEFCSFGHRFRTRLGNGEQPTSEFSPIFVQWLECVYQMIQQYPESFEYSPGLLLFVMKEVFTNRYGTFLVDSERERREVSRKTLSLWSAILLPEGPPQEYVNPAYRPRDGVIYPSCSQISFKLWEDFWFRYQLHPRDEPI
jgi:myotubularin-related protein 1/2